MTLIRGKKPLITMLFDKPRMHKVLGHVPGSEINMVKRHRSKEKTVETLGRSHPHENNGFTAAKQNNIMLTKHKADPPRQIIKSLTIYKEDITPIHANTSAEYKEKITVIHRYIIAGHSTRCLHSERIRKYHQGQIEIMKKRSEITCRQEKLSTYKAI